MYSFDLNRIVTFPTFRRDEPFAVLVARWRQVGLLILPQRRSQYLT